MKALILSILFLITSFYLFPQTIKYREFAINYILPDGNYQTIETDTNGKYCVTIKFPSIWSKKYQTMIIPNMSFMFEDLPEGVTTTSFTVFKINQFKEIPGYNKQPSRDDIILKKIPDSIDFYLEYNPDGIHEHSVYVLCKVVETTGISIIFDSTIDVYDIEKPILESIIKSTIIYTKR